MNDFRQILTDVLAIDQSYPLNIILLKLIEATDHLLLDHSCDLHGYEEWNGAQREARKLLLVIENAHRALIENKNE